MSSSLPQKSRGYGEGQIKNNSGEGAVIDADAVNFYDTDRKPIQTVHSFIYRDTSATEKGSYEHFMLKEIFEQPKAIRKTVSPRIRDGRLIFDDLSPDIKSINKIYIVVCGSSYHVGVVGKMYFERLLRKPVETCLPM